MGVENQLLDGFRLQEKRIEPLTGTVRGGSVDVHLPSKSVEVLLFLARNPRRLVSREALLEKVWGDANASQESLSNTISDIRQALGDSADHPEFIQTVPKRGYRLLIEPVISAIDEQQVVTDRPKRPGLIGNLMDRGVIQAGAIFLVVGWLLIQVADAVVPIIGLPNWTRSFVTYVVIGGFPIVIVFAWLFEYAEGRFYLDKGRDSPTLTTGLERNYLTMVAAYAIAAMGALVYQFFIGFDVPRDSSAPREEILASEIAVEPNSIAVLRFMNIDGSETSEIFSYGFAEDVLDRLARVPGLLVSARGDSWSLSPNSSSDEVRRRLRVAYYLEGSIRLIGDELRVVAQLIDSETGFHIVSRSFDRKLEDFVDVQDEITSLTVANLRVALPEETQMLWATTFSETNVDAYVLYRRGRELFNRPHTEESLSQVADLYKGVLQIDSGYAAAHAGLCITYASTYEISSDAEYIELAEAACAESLAGNPNLHMVHTALGDLYRRTGRDTEAKAAYIQALDINSQDVQAIQGLALTFERQRQIDAAEDLLNQAIRLQPGNWRSVDALGGFLFANGRYADAAKAYRNVVLIDPINWQGHGNLGSALLMAGEFEPAAVALQRALDIEPDQFFYSNLGIINYYLGEFDESVAVHRQAIELSPDANTSWLNLADALLFSSESDRAEEAFRNSARLTEKDLVINPTDAEKLYELAWATAMTGGVERARELIGRSREISPDDPYVYYYDGLLSSREGKHDAAIDALRSAVEMGYPAKLLAAEPYLKEYKNMRRFAELIADTN